MRFVVGSSSQEEHEEPCPETSAATEHTGDSASAAEPPSILYGTAWKGEQTAQCVVDALAAGFRAIDTAAQPAHYREDLVGEGIRRAIQDGLVTREDLYIQTKFTPAASQDASNMPYDANAPIEEQVRASLASSLHNLRASSSSAYLDAVLLHTPLPTRAETLAAWRALEPFVFAGRVRALGVSNFGAGQLGHLLAHAAVAPTIVQNRLRRDGGYDGDVRGARYQAYGALRGPLLGSAAVRSLAAQVGVAPEAALVWLLRETLGVGVLLGSGRAGAVLAGLERAGAWVGDEGNAAAWEMVRREFAALLDA
ncbi:NADP-dependent oxidoreductase domain-containing protein [Xylariomycetidae sp. FL0641]|nr:NADP-dependent oxidoreductase domain-containing protein [Xylariomycetidae sp. FL0641]